MNRFVFFQAEDGIRDLTVTGVQTCALPISLGAWLSYGLGNENDNLPAFVVLTSGGGGQPLQTRYWGNGFLPGNHQGVLFRGQGDPVLYVSNPPGLRPATRRQLLDAMAELDREQLRAPRHPAHAPRIE